MNSHTNGTRLVDRIPYLSLVEDLPFGVSQDKNSDEPFDRTNSKTVLIIEDEKGIRDLLEDLFEIEGYNPTTARTGVEGISRFQDHPYDLVLTDLRMPGVSGSQVARWIKLRSANTPVVIITGWDTASVRDELEDIGVNKVLNKPLILDDLISLASELTGNAAS